MARAAAVMSALIPWLLLAGLRARPSVCAWTPTVPIRTEGHLLYGLGGGSTVVPTELPALGQGDRGSLEDCPRDQDPPRNVVPRG